MTLDTYRIDSHKLIYHPDRVSQWLEAGDEWEKARKVYPIYMEVSPAGGCNHRCRFCALDYIGYKGKGIGADQWQDIAQELAVKGVKSVMFAGEGEPFLNRNMPAIYTATVEAGLDVAFTTNGVLLKKKLADHILPKTSWIKFSINAATPGTYAAIHGTKTTDFNSLIENLKYAVAARDSNGFACTLGAQILLLPENVGEVRDLATLCRDEIGLDYLVVKPHSQHLHSENKQYISLDYERILSKLDTVEELSDEKFQLIYRSHTFRKYIEKEINPSRCCSIPFFWAYIMANLDVYACSAHLLDRRFYLGSLRKKTFSEIWEGEERKKVWSLMRQFDIRDCRINCRMSFINEYLWELRHPGRHVNFI